MRAIKFETKINNNNIQIPERFQSELNVLTEKNVKVIIFVDDSDFEEDKAFKKIATEQFLKGYSDSDSIYDNM